MKTLNLVAIISSALILAAGPAYAEEDSNHSHISKQNLSKRAYQHELDKSAYNKKDNFEGATLIDENVEAESKNRKMRINMLSRRPY